MTARQPGLVKLFRGMNLGRRFVVLGLLVLALIGLTYFLGNLAAGQYAIAGVRDLWGAANFIYFGVVLARLLGVFYYSNSDRLNWF